MGHEHHHEHDHNHDHDLHDQMQPQAEHAHGPGSGCCGEIDHPNAFEHVDYATHTHEAHGCVDGGCGRTHHGRAHEHVDHSHETAASCSTGECGHMHHVEAKHHVDHGHEDCSEGCGHVHHSHAHEHVDHTRTHDELHEHTAAVRTVDEPEVSSRIAIEDLVNHRLELEDTSIQEQAAVPEVATREVQHVLSEAKPEAEQQIRVPFEPKQELVETTTKPELPVSPAEIPTVETTDTLMQSRSDINSEVTKKYDPESVMAEATLLVDEEWEPPIIIAAEQPVSVEAGHELTHELSMQAPIVQNEFTEIRLDSYGEERLNMSDWETLEGEPAIGGAAETDAVSVIDMSESQKVEQTMATHTASSEVAIVQPAETLAQLHKELVALLPEAFVADISTNNEPVSAESSYKISKLLEQMTEVTPYQLEHIQLVLRDLLLELGFADIDRTMQHYLSVYSSVELHQILLRFLELLNGEGMHEQLQNRSILAAMTTDTDRPVLPLGSLALWKRLLTRSVA